MSPDISVPPLIKAVLWMAVALLSFVFMAIAVREIADGMHAFQMVFVRSVLGFLVIAAILTFYGWQNFHTQRLAGHVLRNSVHFVGQVLWMIGIQMLPLATAFAIEFTTPIWAAFMAVLFLGERMNRGRWVALVFGFGGILVIQQPGLAAPDPGVFVMIGCAVFFAMSVVAVKWLTRTDNALTILVFMTGMQAVFGGVASIFVWMPMTWVQAPWLLVMGITGLSAHYAMVRAFGYADATIVVPMDFLRVPLIALVGYLLYAETLTAATLIGAALILFGNYYSVAFEHRSGRE